MTYEPLFHTSTALTSTSKIQMPTTGCIESYAPPLSYSMAAIISSLDLLEEHLSLLNDFSCTQPSVRVQFTKPSSLFPMFPFSVPLSYEICARCSCANSDLIGS